MLLIHSEYLRRRAGRNSVCFFLDFRNECGDYFISSARNSFEVSAAVVETLLISTGRLPSFKSWRSFVDGTFLCMENTQHRRHIF